MTTWLEVADELQYMATYEYNAARISDDETRQAAHFVASTALRQAAEKLRGDNAS